MPTKVIFSPERQRQWARGEPSWQIDQRDEAVSRRTFPAFKGMQTYSVLGGECGIVTENWVRKVVAVMRSQELDPHRRHLAEANLLIVQARAQIERQRLLLETFDTDERARKAKDALAKSEKTLEPMLRGRALILKT
jgi:hypothetical protein